jgi:hypothetical protein
MTKAQRKYQQRARDLGCALCRRLGLGATPASLHHPRTGVGAARKAGEFEVIPLCYAHHQGGVGVHGMGRKAWERVFGITEAELTAETQRLAGLERSVA